MDTNAVSDLMGGVCALARCVMVLMQFCYFLKPPELIKLIKDQIQMVQCGISAQLVATNQMTKLMVFTQTCLGFPTFSVCVLKTLCKSSYD